MNKRILRWLAVALWCGIIFYFSSISSLRITYGIWDLILRKMVHATEFAVLTFLVFKAINPKNRSQIKTALIWAFVFSFLYAVSDEVHQGFVAGRYASVLDIGIDSIGIALVGWYLGRRYYKLSPFNSY